MSMNLSSIKSKNFCVAPWINLHINQQGNLRPCCYSKTNFGLMQNNDWSYIDGSNIKLRNLRAELIAGDNPVHCHGCQEKQWYQEFCNESIQINDVNEFALKSIDVRWGNTCQLSCTYCDHNNSSTWAQLKSTKVHPRLYKEQIAPLFQFIEQNKNLLKRVSLVGGEPLLLNENIDLLELLLPTVGVEVITNLNVNLNSNRIYQQLIKRKNVNWYVSMETVRERFEFVRRRASWDTQIQNLTELVQSIDSTCSVKLQSQYCVYSALNLYELYQWAKSFRLVEVNLITGLTHPDVLNIFLFPDSIKDRANQELDAVLGLSTLTPFEKGALNDTKQQLANSFGSNRDSIINECLDWHSYQESVYFNNQFNFTELWPEYQQALVSIVK